MKIIEALIITRTGVIKKYFKSKEELDNYTNSSNEKKVIIPKWIEVTE